MAVRQIIVLSLLIVPTSCLQFNTRNNDLQRTITTATTSRFPALTAMSPREVEIRRKIRQLKKQRTVEGIDGDVETSAMNDYKAKIRQKLGKAKSKMLGFDSEDAAVSDEDDDDDYTSVDSSAIESIMPGLGALQAKVLPESANQFAYQRMEGSFPTIENTPSVTDKFEAAAEDDSSLELSDDELADLVAEKLQEKRDRQQKETIEHVTQEALDQQQQQQSVVITTSESSKTLTSGIGGIWESNTKQEAKNDVYQPKTGSWGAFPRPRDISKAYGGGRRVGPGYSNEQARAESVEQTRARLQRYKEKVGIEVESEKDHAEEIEEALQIGTLAMQRGMYSTAVSALEKVTKYCSTNSKVGGKVFIELGMAYEAAGRTNEAITVYTSLTKSRIEQTKSNAKRLLYGIEAITFMRDNVNDSAFSRKRASSVFIDTTGLANIASNFDDVYETAYVDLNKSFYKKLTESVVRSSREARQIILQATGPGEVERMRIIQALRSLSRKFAEALQDEIDSAVMKEPVAFIDGKPILVSTSSKRPGTIDAVEDFHLMASDQMLENLDGEWKLQLIADKRGDGVKFFNTTLAWQTFDTSTMTFRAMAPQGFLNVEQSGRLKFNGKRRILRRKDISSSGGIAFADLFGQKLGALGAIRPERQLMLVDSSILVTRGVPNRKSVNNDENEKDYFAVWRRVECGTYSFRRQ